MSYACFNASFTNFQDFLCNFYESCSSSQVSFCEIPKVIKVLRICNSIHVVKNKQKYSIVSYRIDPYLQKEHFDFD
jgi:hypothetical protein